MPLIEALSSFPRLETLESCQGSAPEPAWVCFRYGDYWSNPWQDLTAFVFGLLAPNLDHLVGDDARISVHLSQSGVAVADLYVRQGALDQVVDALRQIQLTERNPPPLP